MLDTMKSTISKGITTVTVKTSSSVEKAKLNTQISSVSKDMERLKQEVGNKLYVLWETDSFDISKVEEELNSIKEKKEKIHKLQDQLEELDAQANSILGTNGEKTSQGLVACVCSNCGNQYEQRINFCVKCGTKMN